MYSRSEDEEPKEFESSRIESKYKEEPLFYCLVCRPDRRRVIKFNSELTLFTTCQTSLTVPGEPKHNALRLL